MDTYPGLALTAEVGKIASIAGSPDRWDTDPEVKRFEVDVIITGESEVDIKPGISSKAEIFVQEKADVISVPLQCVFLEEGESFVYIMGAAGPERRKVQPGIGSDTHREILEGLAVGERVLLYNPNLPGGSTTLPVKDGEQDGGDGGPEDAGGDDAPAPATAALGAGRE
jgi:HlyD family secretion protein